MGSNNTRRGCLVRGVPPIVAPTATGLAPSLGDTAGGETVLVTGTSFLTATGVTVDGASVAFIVVDDSNLTFVAPAHAVGTGNVVVTNPAGPSTAIAYEWWNPSALTLTGFWDRAYAIPAGTATFPGKASGGASSGRNLIQTWGPFQPAIATGAIPNFDAVDDVLNSTIAENAYYAVAAGSGFCLFNADTATAPAAQLYSDNQLFTSVASNITMGISTSGFTVSVWDSSVAAAKGARMAAAVGGWHLGAFRYTSGGTVKVFLDSLTPSSSAIGVPQVAGGLMQSGIGGAGKKFDGRISTMGVANTAAMSDANYAKLLAWARACRGVP